MSESDTPVWPLATPCVYAVTYRSLTNYTLSRALVGSFLYSKLANLNQQRSTLQVALMLLIADSLVSEH